MNQDHNAGMLICKLIIHYIILILTKIPATLLEYTMENHCTMMRIQTLPVCLRCPFINT